MSPRPTTAASKDDRQAPALPAGGGLLLVDKPSGCTSHDVVGRLRHVLRTRRIGHAGTLDPMATGLLVLAVDRSTKLLGHLALTDKTYLATIRLGSSTDTDDADGTIIHSAAAGHLADADIKAGIAALTGPLLQVPSSVSAIKVDGRRAYDRVRAGETVELAARPVTVSSFEVTSPPRRVELEAGVVVDCDVVVDCTTGTYIRSLARDLGIALGVGGHLTRLRRTRVGPFEVDGAADIFGAVDGGSVPGGIDGDNAAVAAELAPVAPEPGHGGRPRIARVDVTTAFADDIAARIIPAPQAVRLAFPTRVVEEAQAADLRYGRPIPAAGFAGTAGVFGPDDELLALVTEHGGRARSVLGWSTAG